MAAAAQTNLSTAMQAPPSRSCSALVDQRAGLDQAAIQEVEQARQTAETKPGVDVGDGVTAADAMREADEAVQEADTRGDAIRAAVACAIQTEAEA